MSREIILLQNADRDIEIAFAYLVENADLEIALRFYESFFASLELIQSEPFIGSQREYLTLKLNKIRMWFVKDFEDYLIFYRVTDNAIEVVRVLHSSQDVENIINSDSIS